MTSEIADIAKADFADWADSYAIHQQTPPADGTILRAMGADEARLEVELKENCPPFIYGRAYIPSLVGQELGWFLQPCDNSSAYGLKCILMPKARDELVRKKGLTVAGMTVKALKVVRKSKSGQSLLCEIAEY